MSTQGKEYQRIKNLLMPQMRKCRDANVRLKVELILYALKLGNVRLACKRLGLGKSFFYKWWQRLSAANWQLKALVEKSRRPRRSPNKISHALEKRIRYYRALGLGPEMIQQYLLREGQRKVSLSVIHHVICGRKPPPKIKTKKLKKHRKRYELPVPGQRLQIDVKYSPMAVEGKTVYIWVAVDECTRWRHARAYPELNAHWTREFLSELKTKFPFPIQCIQTDNGQEFTYKLLGHGHVTSEHPMDLWCRENKITHRLIPPGVKELNGKVERSHRIDADYFYGSAPGATLKAFNKALNAWMRRYNIERPHKGIGYLTPAEKLKERILSLATMKLEGHEEQARIAFTTSVKLVKEEKRQLKVAA